MQEEQKKECPGSAKKMDAAALDANLKVSQAGNMQRITFRDVRTKPFQIYGLYQPQETEQFHRMPPEIAQTVSEGVSKLNWCTTGGRVRFATNSRRIVLRSFMPSINRFERMALTGNAGFDLYETVGSQTTYLRTFMPPVDMASGYQAEVELPEAKMRSFMIHFPIHNPVERVGIGIESGAELTEGVPYHYQTPVVFYGSSITHGLCASRPGNTYPAVISRRYNCDFVNLGFSGNAKGEPAIAEYLATMDMSVFVCDYDYNAPTPEHLENTLGPLIQTVRRAQPALPIVLVSRPSFNPENGEDIRRREIVQNVYHEAVRAGDKRIRFVDGESLFAGEHRDSCTVDACHPNDLGMIRMANVIGAAVGELLNKFCGA